MENGIIIAKQVPQIYMSPRQAAARYSLGLRSIYELMLLPGAPVGRKIGARRLLPIREWDEFIDEIGQEDKKRFAV